MSTFARSNEEAILAAITGELAAMGFKVLCQIGEEADARRAAPPRITWVPSRRSGRRYSDPAQQRAGGKVGHEKNVLFDVHVWGANYPEASRLEDALLAALFNRISPNGYELQDGGLPDEPETPAPGESKGYELVIPIRLLRIPIFAEWRPTATVVEASAAGEVAGPLGEQPVSPAPTITIG